MQCISVALSALISHK